jgi:hypothetical protein
MYLFIFIVSINTIAGGRSSERNLMDDYLQDKTSANPNASAISVLTTMLAIAGTEVKTVKYCAG